MRLNIERRPLFKLCTSFIRALQQACRRIAKKSTPQCDEDDTFAR
jgi:hypothetical protein